MKTIPLTPIRKCSRFLRQFQHLLGLGLFCSAMVSAGAVRDTVSVAGVWKIRLDPQDEGLRAGWPASRIETSTEITLPTTTDLAGLGFELNPATMTHDGPKPPTTRFPGVQEPVRVDEQGALVRRHFFVGPAWYEREIEIPPSWQARRVRFSMERVLWKTDVWLDGKPVGSCDSLVAPHAYSLGTPSPGKHRLTVRIDNRMIHNISTVTHAYGPETQTRWNGMIGALQLEASSPISIESADVFPAPDRTLVRVKTRLLNHSGKPWSGSLVGRVLSESADQALGKASQPVAVDTTGDTQPELIVPLTRPAQPWDEFNPTRYRLQVSLLADGTVLDTLEVGFGFRDVQQVGRELRLNGKKIFLRGTLDCCVYPKTGHPPMTVAEWEKHLQIIKDYGFNHVRFHTWCPPEAAFEAADRLGIYLQPETPAWVDDWGVQTVTKPQGIGCDPQVANYLRREMQRISQAYGNHPSFVLFAIGNEFGEKNTDWAAVNHMVEALRESDPRRLYTGCAARRHLDADQFWVTHHTGAATRGVGPAHTDWDFSAAAERSSVPLIAHETGQRPVFPDYQALLPKFTGPLLPLNLERYQRVLVENGLERQAADFVRASAQFQWFQYKAEHEAMLRTPAYSGYQLLMLNDFTGQSEALVGLLDLFMESKGIVSSQQVRTWNAPTVLLARMPKFVWHTNETFRARLEIAHYGPRDFQGESVHWSVATPDGLPLASGILPTAAVRSGCLTSLGAIETNLGFATKPSRLIFQARSTVATNSWNLWVYPPAPTEPDPGGFLVTKTLDDRALQTLREGGRVLLLGHGLKNANAATTGFESVYWSAGWWGNRFSALGILCDPLHPAFREFPTENASDWQWRDLCAGATTFHLKGAPKGFRPTVQPVPDFHYNTLLAHVLEARVGSGFLAVCGYDLAGSLEHRPAARQFRRSYFRYLASLAFRPAQELPISWVEQTLSPGGLQRRGAKILKVSSEDHAHGNDAANAIDGDPGTFWHTAWTPSADPLPHELIVDLGRIIHLHGIAYTPRGDQANGRIAEAEIFCADSLNTWGDPAAVVRWPNSSEKQEVRFPQALDTRFLKILVRSEVNQNAFAAIAELEVIE